jgi:hypothetical protein
MGYLLSFLPIFSGSSRLWTARCRGHIIVLKVQGYFHFSEEFWKIHILSTPGHIYIYIINIFKNLYVLDRLAGRFQYEILMFQNNLYPSRKIWVPPRSMTGTNGIEKMIRNNDWLVLSKIFYVPFQILG